jgi:hypothetical protein
VVSIAWSASLILGAEILFFSDLNASGCGLASASLDFSALSNFFSAFFFAS